MTMIDLAARNCHAKASPKRTSLKSVLALWRSRRALANLDAHRLEDIGISARKADSEAARPIWDVPQTWRK